MTRLVPALLLLTGCATPLQHGVYAKKDTRYRIGELGPSWQLLKLNENDVAYLSKSSPHSLAVNATCEDHQDPALTVLTRHLLMGFTERQILKQSLETVDHREALRSHVLARLDGVPVELLLVVMKKDDCVYDFTFLSPVGRLEEREETFEHILKTFEAEKRS